jgi:S-adenosylmethionine:tRNA ribosyltransferase-isomerase
MRVSDFDFDLPDELVAQTAVPRGESRLLVLDRQTHAIEHRKIRDLPDFLRSGDVLVANDTRVFPARLLGHRVPSGGAVECLLLSRAEAEDDDESQPDGSEVWEALMHPGQKLKPGARVRFERAGITVDGVVLARLFQGRRRIRLQASRGTVAEAVDAIGHVPLPPYIHRVDTADDRGRFQTVFARERGSVAAPTAGLHFDDALVAAVEARGVERAAVTLHVGYGTFKPVRVDEVERHAVDAEQFDITEAAARAVNAALDDGRRVVAVGTTTTRALEQAALAGGGRVTAGRGVANVFIYPGFDFRVVGALLTNFHLPKSSLLMLACAFAGRDAVLAAYREAVAQRYRFYSYGDAMLIV